MNSNVNKQCMAKRDDHSCARLGPNVYARVRAGKLQIIERRGSAEEVILVLEAGELEELEKWLKELLGGKPKPERRFLPVVKRRGGRGRTSS